jgi:hypothetical protein
MEEVQEPRAGVSSHDRQNLLGYLSRRTMIRHSAPDLEILLSAANAVCEHKSRKSPASVILRKKVS